MKSNLQFWLTIELNNKVQGTITADFADLSIVVERKWYLHKKI